MSRNSFLGPWLSALGAGDYGYVDFCLCQHLHEGGEAENGTHSELTAGCWWPVCWDVAEADPSAKRGSFIWLFLWELSCLGGYALNFKATALSASGYSRTALLVMYGSVFNAIVDDCVVGGVPWPSDAYISHSYSTCAPFFRSIKSDNPLLHHPSYTLPWHPLPNQPSSSCMAHGTAHGAGDTKPRRSRHSATPSRRSTYHAPAVQWAQPSSTMQPTSGALWKHSYPRVSAS